MTAVTARVRGRFVRLVRLVRRVDGERGSATVEFAMTMPAVILVVAFVVASLGVTSQSVRLADAAAVVARQTARGDRGSVGATLARLAPGAAMSESVGADLVCVDLRREVRVGPVGEVTLTSRSCAPTAGR
ncbi:hypothetical protein ASG28_02125 [Frigoribacterium sp. Leaf415]|nr:hypothetical protein ASF07_02125 [Frigoribacterium sp. Leaf254]KQT38639.1 hypothetical protein ASG28_02125 [Frigoribacterium sp. Leaf415]